MPKRTSAPESPSWLTVRLDAPLLEQLRQRAAREDRPVSSMARRLMALALESTSEDAPQSTRRKAAV
jgi:plasmid stability protein